MEENLSFQKIAKDYILHTIEDVDDIVLKLGQMAPTEILGYEIEREYFHFETDGSSGELDKIHLTKEDYDNMIFYPSYTKLNYQEFIDEFNLGQFGVFLRDEYLIGEFNEFFKPQSINYINQASYDGLMKQRLKEVLQSICSAYWELGEISCGWYYNEPLNDIQTTIISLFRESYLYVKDSLINYYKNIQPEIVNEFLQCYSSKSKRPSVQKSKIANWEMVGRFLMTSDFAFEKRTGDNNKMFYLNNIRYKSASELGGKISETIDLKTDAIRNVITETFSNTKEMPNNIFYISHLNRLNQIIVELEESDSIINKVFKVKIVEMSKLN